MRIAPPHPVLRSSEPGAPTARLAAATSFWSEAAEPVEDLTPSEMTVEVAVEVGFQII
jgi:hypothetical protein